MNQCVSCGAILVDGQWAVYDERTGQHFCDRQCFDDWADDNFEKLTEFYKSLNVSDVCL